ncbi:MAG: type IV pilus secretin PilQ [Halobacteriovoraceae bacterium]|nr:type IV pilus secretin PilQ [Halobacteriovoraceae bacterium]
MKIRITFLVFLFGFITPLFAVEQITKINFLQEGEISKLVIDLSGDTLAEKFHVIENKQIIVDVKNVQASPKVLRPIDTSEFSGSVVYISAYPKKGTQNEIRFAIQLRDNVQSRLNFLQNRIVLDIENRFGVFAEYGQTAETTGIENLQATGTGTGNVHIPKSNSVEDILENLTLAGNKKYVGRKISINVKGLPISEILNMIADTSGFNIIIDDAVAKLPPMTLNLSDIPWDEALDTVLKLNKLVAMKHYNILMIKTESQVLAEKQIEIDNEEKFKKKDPLVTKVFPISFAKLSDLVTVLKEYSTEGRGKITQDARTNHIIVKDTVENIEKMKKIIQLLDTATPQILIEAKIVEATEDFTREIGLKDGVGFGYDLRNRPDASDPQIGFTANTAGQGDKGFLNFTVGVYKRLVGLNFTLQLVETERKGKVVSAPKVITQNKQTATITSSTEKSFPRLTGTGDNQQITFDTISADINLNVTPQVTNEGSIDMNISITKGDFLPGTGLGDAPDDRSNASIKTNVLVDNGSTIVIGGLYQTKEGNSEAGVPFLKDIPLIGWLFRTNYKKSRTRNELIVFLTPRIINQNEAGFDTSVE